MLTEIYLLKSKIWLAMFNIPTSAYMLIVFAGSLLLLILTPTALIESGQTICIFNKLFGIEDPGCGITRAVSSIFHGDLEGAINYNERIVVVFPLLCFIYVREFIRQAMLFKMTITNRSATGV